MLAKIQKSLVIVSICAVGAIVVMLIAALFGLEVFKDKNLLAVLLSIAVIAAGCFFANNALDMFNNKKVLSIACLVLLTISAILGFVHFWSHFTLSEGFARFTGIVVITSVLIVIIVTTYGQLNKKFFALQLVTYILVGIIDIVLILALLGVEVFKNGGFTTIFVAICFIAFALLCTINIISKRINKIVENGYIKIKKADYDDLLAKVEELEKENALLKEKINNN